jgi:hypothetical protein
VGIIFLNILPSLDIERALVIEAYKQVRGSPAEAVAETKRRDLPYQHFCVTVRANGFFLRKDLFQNFFFGFKSH